MDLKIKICGWDGCQEPILETNPKTGRLVYYCPIHQEARKKHKRAYYEKNKSKTNKRSREQWNKLRSAFLSMYGGECTCCHEVESVFLTLDHVQNDGKQHRLDAGRFGVYQDAIAQYDPTRFQILCYNCNAVKYHYGVCPHQLISKENSNGK
jgi:hypothetical protein